MKLMICAVALGMMLSGCEVTREADGRSTGGVDAIAVSRGLDAAAAAIAVQCATLDDVLVRLTVDSVARITGNTRRIERLRAERRQVCAEAAVRKMGAGGEIGAGEHAPAP